jgi:hypothetical protein
MNTHTITWSLWLSRWKQLVLMSASSVSLQMGRLYLRQKARLHCLHELDASRGVRGFRGVWERGVVSVSEEEEEEEVGSEGSSEGLVSEAGGVVFVGEAGEVEEGEGFGGGGGGGAGWSCCGPSGMMVLFWPQVHLQKEGTAVGGGGC